MMKFLRCHNYFNTLYLATSIRKIYFNKNCFELLIFSKRYAVAKSRFWLCG